MIEYKNPYGYIGEYDKEKHSRLTCDISRDDYLYVGYILPHKSDAVYQTTAAMLWHLLVETLKLKGIQNNVTYGNDFKSFLSNLKLVDGRNCNCAIRGVVPDTSASNDAGAVARPSESNKNITDKHDGLEGSSVKRPASKKRTKKK